MNTTASSDNQPRPSTKDLILQTAESLFAEHGMQGTATRTILREAGQRNESALQYHFGSRDGLIDALYTARGEQVERERALMLVSFDRECSEGTLSANKGARIRRLCEVAFLPAVRVANQDSSFVRFLKVVGQLAFLPSDALQASQQRYEGETIRALGERLRPLLEAPDEVVEQRLELISRFAAVALAQRARAGASFDGPEANFFFSGLLDAMAATLLAPVSTDTQQHLQATRSTNGTGTS